jgi:hypothetical protein
MPIHSIMDRGHTLTGSRSMVSEECPLLTLKQYETHRKGRDQIPEVRF